MRKSYLLPFVLLGLNANANTETQDNSSTDNTECVVINSSGPDNNCDSTKFVDGSTNSPVAPLTPPPPIGGGGGNNPHTSHIPALTVSSNIVTLRYETGANAPYYVLQKRDGDGKWVDAGTTSKGIKQWTDVQSLNQRSYRVSPCTFEGGCSSRYGWPSNKLTFVRGQYVRNTNDRNSNGVRDDIDDYINTVYPGKPFERAVLERYAKKTSEFMSVNLNSSTALVAVVQNLQSMLVCLKNDSKASKHFSKIESITWDSRDSFAKYLRAENAYAHGPYARYNFQNSCYINRNTNTFDEQGFSQNLHQSINNAEQQNENADNFSSLLHSNVDELATTSSSSDEKKRFVLYLNGMLTTLVKATGNMEFLEDKLNEAGHSYNVQMVHNRDEGKLTEGHDVMVQHLMQTSNISRNGAWQKVHELVANGFIGASSVKKKLVKWLADDAQTSKTNEADLKKAIDTIKLLRNRGDVVVVAHSQGNFFANEAISRLLTSISDLSTNVRVLSVATPAFIVPFNGPYVTNRHDEVIQEIRNTSPVGALPGNISSTLEGGLNHGFKETYLNRIIKPVVIKHIEDLFAAMDVADTSCTPLAKKRYSGFKTLRWTPGRNYNGWVTLRFDALPKPNSFQVTNQFGTRLLTTPTNITKKVSLRHFYRSKTDGFLTIVGRPTTGGSTNQFDLEGVCGR